MLCEQSLDLLCHSGLLLKLNDRDYEDVRCLLVRQAEVLACIFQDFD